MKTPTHSDLQWVADAVYSALRQRQITDCQITVDVRTNEKRTVMIRASSPIVKDIGVTVRNL